MSASEPGCAAARTAFTVRVEPGGWRFDAPPWLALLSAAQRAGVRLPSSCRNGTCRTCLSRLRSGTVVYRIEWPGLSAEEHADGYILPCVAHACADLVIERSGVVAIAPD